MIYSYTRSTVPDMNRTESKATRSKFHKESCDNLFIFTTVATHCYGNLEFVLKDYFCNQRNHFFRFVYIYSAAAADVATADV